MKNIQRLENCFPDVLNVLQTSSDKYGVKIYEFHLLLYMPQESMYANDSKMGSTSSNF